MSRDPHASRHNSVLGTASAFRQRLVEISALLRQAIQWNPPGRCPSPPAEVYTFNESRRPPDSHVSCKEENGFYNGEEGRRTRGPIDEAPHDCRPCPRSRCGSACRGQASVPEKPPASVSQLEAAIRRSANPNCRRAGWHWDERFPSRA
jgi:hypothetical protein